MSKFFESFPSGPTESVGTYSPSTSNVVYDNPFPQYGTASTYTNPDNLFNSNFSTLAPAFAAVRYDNYKNPQGEIDVNLREHPSIARNVGAVQIYNRNNNYSTPPYAVASQKVKGYEDPIYNYGHSEPRLMLEGLKQVYEQDKLRPHDNLNPAFSANVRSPHELESLTSLVNDPFPHRNFLERTNRYIKMLSERPSCGGQSGGGCSQFMRNIAPGGSKFGHTVDENYKNTEEKASNERAAIEALREPYRNYLLSKQRSNNMPIAASPFKLGQRKSANSPGNPANVVRFFSSSANPSTFNDWRERELSKGQNTPSGKDIPVVDSFNRATISPLLTSPRRGARSTPPAGGLSQLNSWLSSTPVKLYSPNKVSSSTPVETYSHPSPYNNWGVSSSDSGDMSEENSLFPSLADMMSPKRATFESYSDTDNYSPIQMLPPGYLQGVKFSPGSPPPKSMLVGDTLYRMPDSPNDNFNRGRSSRKELDMVKQNLF